MERNWRRSLKSRVLTLTRTCCLFLEESFHICIFFLCENENLTAARSASVHDPPTAGRREYSFLCIALLPTSHPALSGIHSCYGRDTSGRFPDALWWAVASVRELTAFLTVSSSSPTWNYSLSVPSPFCFLWLHSTKMQESALHPLALVRIQCRHTLSPAALWNVELLLCWVVEKRGCTWVPLTFPTSGSVPGT